MNFKKDSLFSGVCVVLFTWGAYFSLLWLRMFQSTNEGISVASRLVWSDWACHFTYAGVFAYRSVENWFEQHPLFYGHAYDYPFLVNMVSGLLMRLGLGLTTSFVLPSIICSYAMLLISFNFFKDILGTNKKAFTALSLFLMSGGMGFCYFLIDWCSNPSFLTFFFPPREYALLHQSNIQWPNVVASEFLPQRAILLGFPIALYVITKIYNWEKYNWMNTKNTNIFLVGAFSSILIITHIHSFMVLFFTFSLWFILDLRHYRKWILFASGTILPSVFLIWFFHRTSDSGGFFRWYPGWMSNPTEGHPPSFLLFWWINWGFFLPFSLFASYRNKTLSHPVYLAGLLLFLLCNLIKFQPWAWDNTKILTYSYLFMCFPIASMLVDLWKKNEVLYSVAALLMFITITASGGLELIRLLNANKLRQSMWRSEEIKLAEDFRALSKTDSIVLTSDQHHHWVATLTGRQILMGYAGWLSSYGIDYTNRKNEIEHIFKGLEDASTLLRKYQVNYVVIGPSEINDYHANEDYFKRLYPLALSSEHYRVYQIKK